MKTNNKYLPKWSTLSVAVSIALAGSMATHVYAAEGEEGVPQDPKGPKMVIEEDVERIAVVGSRAAPRSVGESPVPIDIVDGDEFTRSGVSDMSDLLGKVVPSYNVNVQPISDAATLIRPANMRGLAPDHTLVLVNGKRRHRASVISFLGAGISDGAQGPDISVIPSIALKQVEVLRDGAAAIYGSDAIAGVINFVLKDASEGGEVEVKYGQYYEGDGESPQIAANIGLPFTDEGFINLSMEYREADPTSRSVQREDAAGLIEAGNTHVADPAQIWGSPEVKEDAKLFFNAGIDLSETQHAYMFGNWARRNVEGGFYFRNPNTRGGVFKGNVRNVGGVSMYRPGDDDVAGQEAWDAAPSTILVGALEGGNQLDCPVVEIMDNVPNQAALDSLAAANCFAFNSMFPGGFTPRFGGIVEDTSLAVGVQGTFSNEINYDFSGYYGRNESSFYIKNTVNPSMGPNTPTSFKPGSYVQLERGLSADFSYYEFDTWSLASGVEYRRETFDIINGDTGSFEIGPLASQGFGIGSNGFPGFKPEDAGSFSRTNFAIYFDAEKELGDSFLVTGAVRYEYYDDFGATTNGKLGALWNATDELSFRAAASTGFRAPTVGQNNVRNVTTAFGPNGLEDQATLPPTNPIAIQKGATPLEPETSVNFSIGSVLTLDQLFVTVDYFHIKLEDRLSQTSNLALTQEDKDLLIAQGVLDASSFASIKYFTNDFDTTTQGVDIVANYLPDWLEDGEFALAYNWTDTTVDDYNPANISRAKVIALEDSLPAHKATFTWNQGYGNNFYSLLRINYYGEYFENHLDAEDDYGNPAMPILEGASVTVDLELSYDFSEQWTVSVGAQNLFDQYPDDNPYEKVAGAKYPVSTPYGFNGGYYYGRVNYRF
ncbi:TonB-dependent receptor plug domain-containing protein [Shewanella marina]|uniref:TonB-dependent receptor plug domain-containing protein n=1 Tax=Shewanella marina TaxID=487319 RepID=UPI00046ECDCB|nr:TonB-dependent receptor [Shewanella marina]